MKPRSPAAGPAALAVSQALATLVLIGWFLWVMIAKGGDTENAAGWGTLGVALFTVGVIVATCAWGTWKNVRRLRRNR